MQSLLWQATPAPNIDACNAAGVSVRELIEAAMQAQELRYLTFHTHHWQKFIAAVPLFFIRLPGLHVLLAQDRVPSRSTSLQSSSWEHVCATGNIKRRGRRWMQRSGVSGSG